jgi:hypothetical protein
VSSDCRNDDALDGESFGLAFALGLAAQLLGQPFPSNWVATGKLDALGRVTAVSGVAQKLALSAQVPLITHALVPSQNLEEARRAAPRLTIVGVCQLREALRVLWTEAQLRSTPSMSTVQQQARELFNVCLDSRANATSDWRPVAAAAQSFLETYDADLSEADRSRLQLARQIASRHAGEWVEYQAPHPALRDDLMASRWLELLAHLVQSSTDLGSPSLDELRPLLPELPPHRERHPSHLRLLGALGRLYAITGEAERGLECQLEAARSWWEERNVSELSYPLSAGFQLAGALGDQESFDALEALYVASRELASQPEGDCFVRLSRARGLVALGRDDAALWSELKALAADAQRPEHLRLTAMRLLLKRARRAGEDTGQEAEHWASFEALARSGTLSAHDEAEFRALVALETALERGGDAPRALKQLVEVSAQPTGMLMAAAEAKGKDAAAWVARFWPY